MLHFLLVKNTDDHLVRKIDVAIDFEYIYDLVSDLYSPTGKPSIDPVVLIKICLVQYLFGIRSMRKPIEEIQINMAYRWFLGYDMTEAIPHFSTFGKNYSRRFEGTKVFETIFNRILMQGVEEGFVDPTVVFIDGTHVKANANKNKRVKVVVKEQTRSYRAELEEEINEERKAHGQKPLAKVKHAMRDIKYRGIGKVRDHSMLLFACMNMKKIARWKWNRAA